MVFDGAVAYAGKGIVPFPVPEGAKPTWGIIGVLSATLYRRNIDLHDPNWKVDVGCMLSDFMVVRPGQAELLVNVPRELGEVG